MSDVLIFVGMCLAALAVLVAVICVSIHVIGVRLDSSNCKQFGQQTNRTVKFVKYNYMKWDCLTPTSDGKWIPTNQLRDVAP